MLFSSIDALPDFSVACIDHQNLRLLARRPLTSFDSETVARRPDLTQGRETSIDVVGHPNDLTGGRIDRERATNGCRAGGLLHNRFATVLGDDSPILDQGGRL